MLWLFISSFRLYISSLVLVLGSNSSQWYDMILRKILGVYMWLLLLAKLKKITNNLFGNIFPKNTISWVLMDQHEEEEEKVMVHELA